MNDLLQSIKSTSCFLQFGFSEFRYYLLDFRISEFWIQNFGIFHNIPLWVLYEPISIEKKNSSEEVEEDEAGRKTFMLKLES